MKKKIKKYWLSISLLVVTVLAYYFSLPSPLFHDPFSTVLDDRGGNLLSASIAKDGQWRFPLDKEVNQKFTDAIILTEDKRFYHHIGVDPLALSRAIAQNLRAGKVISGGSTLSMQVIRLSRKNKPRTFFEKTIELILATRLEFGYSKKEILALYAAHAPFGGNVVGVEAACWRFFDRNPSDLSWAEAALLAVLPNNPSLIHLGKNRIRLKDKRDQLLDKLARAGKMDSLTLQLAKAEPVPQAPVPLPRLAPHLLARAVREGKGQEKIITTIDQNLQQHAAQIIDQHHQKLKANHIYNASAVIVEVKTGNVLAYIGNTASGRDYQEAVDVVAAPRSTGSILKPFLYAAMLNEGNMLQHTLWPDVPTFINGYAPKNFSKGYEGAVHANDALIRSLNVPAVYELRDYRYEKFYDLLTNIGITTLKKQADHYGLTLILGGAEGSLWDITGVFASMARTLNNYGSHTGKMRYNKIDFHGPVYANKKSLREEPGSTSEETSWLSAASIYLTMDALKEVYRPSEESGWRYFNSTKKIAWKTGTSFGFRDGWAVGTTPDYAVGVWVGNADGEGRPGLTGTDTAAPILFDLFSLLPGNSWFQIPYAEMSQVAVCAQSGMRATPLCEKPDTVWIAQPGLQTLPCSYHKKLFLSPDKKYRLHSNCESISNMTETTWFVLPPIQEFYFKYKNFGYRALPPWRTDCANTNNVATIDIIYPKPNSKVYIPYELDERAGSTLFEAAHRNPSATIFWHLDGQFLKATRKSHKISVHPDHGTHTLLLMDDAGESISRTFAVVSSKR